MEGRLIELEKVKTETLTERLRVRLDSTLKEARAEWQQTEHILDVARGLMKTGSASSPDSSENQHSRVQWKWTPVPFHGRKGEWTTWWQVYSTAIHNDKTLTNDWKMKGLSDCLKGEAADVLGNLDRTGSNYIQAITLLQSRFGDPLVLSKVYYEQIESLPPATNLRSQRQTLDKLTAYIRNLESLKDKIPVDENLVKRQVCRKFSTEFMVWALNDLQKKYPKFQYPLHELLTALESTIQPYSHLATLTEDDSRSSEPQAVGVLAVGTSNYAGGKRPNSTQPQNAPPQKKKVLCVYCDGAHVSADCRRFATVQARKNRLTEQRRCHNCLIPNHETSRCRGNEAKCGRCARNHHTALCVVPPEAAKRRGNVITISDSFLPTFICLVRSHKGGKEFLVRGIFDTASKHSYITLDIAKKLNLPSSDPFELNCLCFADETVKVVQGYHVRVTLFNSDNNSRTFNFLTTPCITGDFQTCPPPEETVNLLPPLLNYADYDIFLPNRRPLKILVGADNLNSLLYSDHSYNLTCGIRMNDSFFGWVPSGGVLSSEASMTISSTSLLTGNENLEDLSIPVDINFNFMWRLEVLGIESPNQIPEKGSDYVVEHYKRTSYIDHLGRKNISIPWKECKTELPSNFRVALARLKNLILKTPPDLLKLGDAHFKQQEQEGIIEVAPPLSKFYNISDRRQRVHYMPHRWLLQKGKIRVVYDASAPTKGGVCLNNLIYQGANLTNNIVRLLLNFRLFKVALVADIEKAFLQISLNESDRDSTRFLWLKDINKPVTESNLSYKRFARLPMGLNVSPCILNLVLADIFNEPPINPWLIGGEKIFYADNLVTSVPTNTDALEIFQAMTARLNSIKMNLRDWATNDEGVADALPLDKTEKSDQEISILGIPWDRKQDLISIKLDPNTPLTGTKRNVLKFYASIYDPLGLIAPTVLELKLFIQQCWKNKYDWNTTLPYILENKWFKLRDDALRIPSLKLPRQYFDHNPDIGNYELHIFCDASQKAYACCAYLVYKNSHSFKNSSQLVFSKIRIAPPTNMTIPKLELLAVVIGNRTAQFLRQNMTIKIDKTVLWTDATTILQWLNSSDILPPFIHNRITEIKQSTDVLIKFVPTSDNPADCASRGQSVPNLEKNSLWWHGPKWLPQEKLWPKAPLNVMTVTLLTNISDPLSGRLLSDHLERNFHSWTSRVRVFYYVLKACFIYSRQPFYATDTDATIKAEKLLIKELQSKYFPTELTMLKKGKRPPNNLDLFLDNDSLIRCRGRLHHARFPWEMKHPILLPRDSPATFSLIKEIHDNNAHIGAAHTLAKLRENYWIIKGRAKVKSVIHSCHKCRYWYGGNYSLPPIPPLPESRVADVTPFLQTGLDAFGPLHIKNERNETVDVQVLIFTCLVTRAIHLELVPDLSGEHFLMALDRFCCLKRVPKLVISDNAKTFVFIQPMVGIKVHITDHKINNFITSNRVEWYFIPQYAPWFGGAYERLIQIVKKCLKISYGKTFLTYIELQTTLYKIADIVNSRPLTYISDEVVEPLTPNHFVKLGPTNVNTSLALFVKPPLTNTGAHLIDKWATLIRILEGYWDAFKNLYLASLRERHTTHHPEKKGTSKFLPHIGDVVLIKDPGLPRAYWKMGRIEKLDHRQAVAHVRQNKHLLLRSIRHLYPLEVADARPRPSTSTSA